MNAIKSHLKKSPVYWKIKNFREKNRQKKKYRQWAINNKPSPPPDCVKQSIILKYAKTYNIDALIETGTFLRKYDRSNKTLF